jgi:hypothetical protein
MHPNSILHLAKVKHACITRCQKCTKQPTIPNRADDYPEYTQEPNGHPEIARNQVFLSSIIRSVEFERYNDMAVIFIIRSALRRRVRRRVVVGTETSSPSD